MQSDWRQVTLGEFVRLQRGHDLTASEQRPGQFPVMGSAGPNGTHAEFKAFGPGVVIGRSGASMGRVHFCETDYWPHNTCLYVTDFLENNPLFAFYKLAELNLARYNSGSAQPSLNRNYIYGMSLWIPSRHIQDQIVRVVHSIDKKIDLYHRINQTLEAMAQAIFQSWFVDFDPVKAKITAKAEGSDPLRAAMSAISGKADAELDALSPEQYEQLAATAALFPDDMEESEYGEIPKGWGFRSVADVAEFGRGKVDVSILNEDIYISTENMLENRGGVSRATSLPSVATVPSFKTGQILVSNIRPYFKKIWMAHFDGGRSPDVLAFESIVPQSTEFLYNLMYQDAFFEFMTRTAKGAKMPRGDKDAIMGWRFPCPDEVLMVCFSEKVRHYYEYINSLKSESDSLAELRDTLLPKLLSGELSVADAMVEAVA